MNGTPSKAMIDDSANIISTIVCEMDVKKRGHLFLKTAEILSRKDQYYTAGLFKKIAVKYGCEVKK